MVTIAWATRPELKGPAEVDRRGKTLIDDFDPLKAASLEIVEFDETTSTPRAFQVAQLAEKGKTRWSIPSHDNYPADAKEQLAEAATALLGLKILDVAGDNPGDHEQFGVVDPSSKDLKVGSTGVGTRVTMKDKNGKTLLSVILGNVVADRPQLHYVRLADDDTVYVVDVKTDKISSKFGDWIEKNLLKMTTWDLKQAWIRDYSVDLLHQKVQQKSDMTLAYDDQGNPKWKILKDGKFVGNKPVAAKMAANEELNAARLDEMKTALDDLKIVDVRRKPKGLSDDLKASADFLNNEEASQSLANRGFYPADLDGRPELLSNEGEVRYLMKDGVEYVLRFGAVAIGTENAKKETKKGAKTGNKKDSGHEALNRYLLVMAEFKPDSIAKPELEPLPSETAPSEAKKDGKEASGKGKTDAKKGSAEKEQAEVKKPVNVTALKAERERIEKENERKQDEYQDKITKGLNHAKELNARFADWYYVISDDVYRKIHLTRDQIIQKKQPKAKTGKGAEAHGHGDHDESQDFASPAEPPVPPPAPKSGGGRQ